LHDPIVILIVKGCNEVVKHAIRSKIR